MDATHACTAQDYYVKTLRLPTTSFPMRGLSAPAAAGGMGGRTAMESDLAGLEAVGLERPQEAYRTLRNGFRFMLGSLAWLDGKAAREEPPLEVYMRTIMLKQDGPSAGAARAVAFVERDLLRFFFDARKDALYCDPAASDRRLAALSFMAEAVSFLAVALKPAAPFLCAEVMDALPEQAGACAPQQAEPSRSFSVSGWEKAREVHKAAQAALDQARTARTVGSSLEAILEVTLPAGEWAMDLAASGWVPEEILCVSAVSLREGESLSVSVRRAEGPRCARSWRYSGDVGSDPRHPLLSARDAAAVEELGRMPVSYLDG